MQPLAYRRSEAAAALAVSPEVFDRDVRPHIACCRVGSLVLFPVDELRRWLEQTASSPIADLDARRAA